MTCPGSVPSVGVGRGPASSAPQLGQAEIENLHAPSRVTNTFSGFRSRWTMPRRAPRPDRADLTRVVDRLAHRQRAAVGGEASRPRAAPRRHRRAGVGADVVDGEDVGMVECRRPRALPARSAARRSASARRGRRKHLDRDLALQPRVARAIDLAHAACAKGATISYGPRRVPAPRPMCRDSISVSAVCDRDSRRCRRRRP